MAAPSTVSASYKIRSEIFGHEQDVRAVSSLFSDGEESLPPSQAIVTASRDRTARIWTANLHNAEFTETHSMVGHSNFVSCVCTAPPSSAYPDGLVITGSHDKNIRGFTLSSQEAVFVLSGHTDSVTAVTVDKCGTIVSGSWDKSVKLWSHETCLQTLQGHQAAVWAVAVIPEQGLTLSASADRLVLGWKKGEVCNTYIGHEDCVRGLVVISPSEFLSCSNDATVRRWQTASAECTYVFYSHTNFVYAIASIPGDEGCFASVGEDSTLRVWRGTSGSETCLQTINLPAQSIWCVAALQNGDIAVGCSDGVTRVFSKDSDRQAAPEVQTAFKAQVELFKTQMSSSATGKQGQAGGGEIKPEDLSGPEALANPGCKNGQTTMIRQPNGKVEAYSWNMTERKWDLLGEVVGSAGGENTQATSESNQLHGGKEYDYVFSVDIEEGKPPLKLPYNRTDDPWAAAHKFLSDNLLPATYLDQVAHFIMENAKGIAVHEKDDIQSAAVVDPLTGGSRYVPGPQPDAGLPMVGQGEGMQVMEVGGQGDLPADPLTGGGRYIPGAANALQSNKQMNGHGTSGLTAAVYVPANEFFPRTQFLRFDAANVPQIFGKLGELNGGVPHEHQLSNSQLQQALALVEAGLEAEPTEKQLKTLEHMLLWPSDLIFPALDVIRLAMRNKQVNAHFCCSPEAGQKLYKHLLTFTESSMPLPNQMLAWRVIANTFSQSLGEKLMKDNAGETIGLAALAAVAMPAHKGVQIAVSTVLVNLSVQWRNVDDLEVKSQLVSSLTLLLASPHMDDEARFRLVVAMGTLVSADLTCFTFARSLELGAILKKGHGDVAGKLGKAVTILSNALDGKNI